MRGKGRFMLTEFVPTEERTGARFPLILTTGRILSQYNVGAQTRRTENIAMARRGRARHPSVRRGEPRHAATGDLVAIQSRSGEISLRAVVSERMQPGVVYTTFHHPMSGANVVTTEFSDWATNCPEYKVTAVQVRRTNGPSAWQEHFADETRHDAPGRDATRSRRIAERTREKTVTEKIDKLVRMANQIADFFTPYPDEEAVAGVQEHIRSFWTPSMREELAAYAAAGGKGLDPRVLAGDRRLSRRRRKPGRESDRRPGGGRPARERRRMRRRPASAETSRRMSPSAIQRRTQRRLQLRPDSFVDTRRAGRDGDRAHL